MVTMKVFLLIACWTICSASSLYFSNNDIENELQIADDSSNLVKRDLRISFETLGQTQKDLPNRVFFYLYTRKNPKVPQKLIIDDVQTLKKSNFDIHKETKIVTHGWTNSYLSPSCQLILQAFLENSDCNVILIDWSKIADQQYFWAAKRVLMVGKFAARMVSFLEAQGLDENKLTVVGHSLGAHVAGLTSNYATRKANYVVGLDPAQPDFILRSPDSKFFRGQGKFVEAIHSDAGALGMNSNIGDADFWPDGGHVQLGCKITDLSCSHARSYQYFAESINSKIGFIGVQCSNYIDYLQNKCANNPRGIMGGAKPQAGLKGSYYLKTNDKAPFARGSQ